MAQLLGYMLVVIWLGVSVSASRGRGDPDPDPYPDMSQREVTFDLSDIWGLEDEDTDGLMQKEVTFDLPDLLRDRVSNYSGSISQREVTDEFAVDLTPRGPGQFGPRGHAPPRVAFPHGRPTPQNVQAICLHGTGRPRYPAGALPRTSFSHLSRQADALHRAEAWYSQQCCQGNWQQDIERTLCCTHQAWEKALELFCEEEFSIKTSHYFCCKIEGKARWNCFEREAPNPSYQATTHYFGPELLPRGPAFTFTNKCPRSQRRPQRMSAATRAQRGQSGHIPDISFPPGRPTSSNIRMVCKLRKLRPRYTPSCLPSGGFGWLARQSKAINRLERGLKLCCKAKKDVLACADGKWREEMDRFCQDEHGVKTKHYECCKLPEGEARLSCFSSKAPFPDYRGELLQRQIVPADLSHFCVMHKILNKQKVALPVDNVVNKCCHLVPEQRNACVVDMLDSLQRESCSAEPPSPMVTPDCCVPNPPKCFLELLMKSIFKGAETPSFRRKRCPLSTF
ncbi:extracellular matrix protein 1-like isoform X2 [Clupea harengus]|uniref:Extracellular matrix protein 1-like isoform X2 n=1 Tax=Clupea harengus TaxID=7950 RepID=A0A6P3VZ01_CLUHA|nr:extracellular matrix protein 1-like isoform X2 [Clupea harengus]